MKVVYLLNIFPKITETFILNEILAMQKKGVSVEVFAYKDEKEDRVHPRAKEISRRYFSRPGLAEKFYAHFYWLRRDLKRYFQTIGFVLSKEGDGTRRLFVLNLMDTVIVDRARPDHLHAHFGDEASNTAMLIHLLSGVPFTFTTHSYDIFEGKYDNWKIKSRLAKKHVTISEYNKNYVIDHYNVDPGDVEIVHCGIDFENVPPASEAREEGFLFTAARLHAEKGLDVLIRACRLLKDENVPFRCEIAGDGAERADLEKMIGNLELWDKVSLLGNQTQEEVFEKLKHASIFVLPSRSEGIPVSLMEAMAFRVPVIATWICGIPELIQDGESGFLMKPEDPGILAKRIKELLADNVLRKTFADNGRRKVFEEFNLQRETDKLLSLWTAGAER